MPEGGRVIAGVAGGIRLVAPQGSTRTLTDRVKESLFASLESENALIGTFLDLFAGSGAAGIEALSRGALEAVFVERDRRACESIRTNLERTRLGEAHVVCADVRSFLSRPQHGPFATVFVDPPYESGDLEAVLEVLGSNERHLLREDAVVVAKHFWKEELAEMIGTLTKTRQKRFGETMLSFYTRKRRSDDGS
jgi:16S rRNA (guanine966-N2)-methyltransferase